MDDSGDDIEKDGNKHSSNTRQPSMPPRNTREPLRSQSSTAALWCSGLRVVITGGSGFLGRHIARVLYREAEGVRIVLMDPSGMANEAMNFITGEKNNRGNVVSHVPQSILIRQYLDENLKEADVVIHCATMIERNSQDNNREMYRVNVEGTRNVVEACKKSDKVRALVYAGALFQAIKDGVPNQEGIHEENDNIKEDDELLLHCLGRSKNEAEKLVLAANGDRFKLYTCSIRSPPIYGESDTTFIPSAAWAAQKFFGYYPRLGSPHVKMTAIYAENAAHAHICAARELLSSTKEEVGGQYYYVTDDTPFESYNKFLRRFLEPVNIRGVVLPIKLVTLWFYIIIVYMVFLNVVLGLPADSHSVLKFHRHLRILSISHTVNRKKAEKNLKYKPIVSFDDALHESIRYYHAFIRSKAI